MSENVINGYRMSPQQERLWMLQQVDSGMASCEQCAVLLEGPLDLASLSQALTDVVRRHEILRTNFESVPEMDLPVQVITEGRIDWDDPRDLSGHDHAQQQRELETLFDQGRKMVKPGGDSNVHISFARLSANSHVMVLSLPALCSDAPGMTHLIRELSRGYGTCLETAERPAAPTAKIKIESEALQYADLSEWQNDLLDSAETDVGRRYWRRQELMDGLDLKLPLERNHTTAPRKHQSHVYSLALDAAVGARIDEMIGRDGGSQMTFWLTCWRALLWRLTGQIDLAIGTGYDGRNDGGLERALGLFTKYLPLDIPIAEEIRFDELMQEVGRKAGEAGKWQQYFSWNQIAGVRGNGNGNKVTDNGAIKHYAVGFDFVEAGETFAVGNLRMSIRKQQTCIEQFKIKLTCSRSEEFMRLDLDYDAGLYEAAYIERMASQLVCLARGAVASPQTEISRLDILSGPERAQVTAEFNGHAQEPSRGLCLHELVEEQAEHRPEAAAVAYEQEQISYNELNRRANQLGHYLQARGVGPEVRVAVCLDRSIGMVVAVLGILKSGGAYVPVDLDSPPERIAFILADAGTDIVVTQSLLADRLPDHTARVISLDTQRAEIASQSEENLAGGVMPENLAYVIYTSGSTGLPKGVSVCHSNVTRLFEATRNWFHFDKSDVWTLFHSYAFDFSVWELWGPLIYGGNLVVVPYWISRSPEAFYKLLCEKKVTILNQTPSGFSQLSRAEESPESIGYLALRLVIFGGEALDFQSLKPWFNRHGDQEPQMVNMYGITETTVHVTYSPVTIADLHKSAGSIIGVPIPDLQVYILDTHLEPAPIGVEGELHVGGKGLARGYLNQSGLTAERFIPSPFSLEPGARLYRSGDLARRLPDGSIEYLGRIDHQVKLRGYRIEPGEIEAVIANHGGVREAVVIAREDVAGDKRLVAYVVAAADTEVSALDLRRYAREKLPDYMVPAAFVMLDRLPLTNNGKLDRRALPAPEESGDDGDTDQGARSVVEEILAGIWGEVLKVGKVGINDNFFELGGHSLLATQVISRIREVFHVEVPLRSLFETPTVAAIASSIDKLSLDLRGIDALPITAASREGKVPLSFAQQRLWFLHQLEPDSPAYNIPSAVRMSGKLNVPALEMSLSEMIKRHEVLRTSFVTLDGELVQAVNAAEKVRLEVEGLEDLGEQEREDEAQRIADEEGSGRFDLERGPLMRVRLLRLSEEEHILLYTMHHIVSDGWSRGVLVREMGALYEAFCAGKPSPLEEMAIQYADYAVWQREWLGGEAVEPQLSYWREQLRAAPVLEMPTDWPRPALQSHKGARESFEISAELTARLKQLSRREGVTLYMTLLAALNALLYRYTGREDIVVGTPIANRNRAEIEGLIGFFVNTLVLRVEVKGEESFRDMLTKVREVSLAAYAHQDVPFERLVEELKPDRDLSHTPLFQVMFSYDSGGQKAIELEGLRLDGVNRNNESAKFEMTMSVEEVGERLIGTLIYRSELFEGASIKRLIGHYEQLLESIATDVEERVAALKMLTQEERNQLLGEWAATAAIYPPDRQERFFADLSAELNDLFGAADTSTNLPAPAGVLTRDDLEFYVLDQCLQPAPPGVTGELYIKGFGLLQDYLDRVELPAQRLIPNPFSRQAGQRLFKSGNLARYLPGGNIENLGRVDQQIMIRGHHVKTREIESLLRKHETVLEAFVMARECSAGDWRLVAYITARDGAAPGVDELRKYVREKLPGYMVPEAVVVLGQLPLARGGEVDAEALPMPDWAEPQEVWAFLAPRTVIEETLANIWAEVLQVEHVGVNNNFFDLGGHSLLITQAHDKLQKALDRDVSIIDLFKYPTIAALAEYLTEGESEQPSSNPDPERAQSRQASMRRRRDLRQKR